MKVHGFLPLHIAPTPPIHCVYERPQTPNSLLSNVPEKTADLVAPNIMSQEIVTYKTTG